MTPMGMAKMLLGRPAVFGGCVVALLGVFSATSARAEMLLADTALVNGTSSDSFSFNVPSAGTVEAQVANLDWPQWLNALTFQTSTANQVLSSWSDLDPQAGANSEILYFKVQPGTYFADVTATAGGPLGLGLYSFTLTFAPAVVPLPSSFWLLLAGIVVLIVPVLRTLPDAEGCSA